MVLLFVGVLLGILSFEGCKGGKTIRNEVSHISMKVRFEKEPPIGVLLTEHDLAISIQIPPSMTDVTKEKVETTIQKFDFEQLDRGTQESLLAEVAESTTQPLKKCQNISAGIGQDSKITQYEDGSIGIDVMVKGIPALTALAKRKNGKPAPCAAELKTNPNIVSKYRDIYAKFLAAMEGKAPAAPAASQASISTDSK